jgi:hypothetical protein
METDSKNDEEQRWLQRDLTLQSERNRDSERVQTQRQDESNDAREHISVFHGNMATGSSEPYSELSRVPRETLDIYALSRVSDRAEG